MATAAKVLDETRFEARARIGDILAVGLVLVVGGVLFFEMYTMGFTAAAAAADGSGVLDRDKRFVMMIIEAAVVVASMGWIVYRLLSGSARRVGG